MEEMASASTGSGSEPTWEGAMRNSLLTVHSPLFLPAEDGGNGLRVHRSGQRAHLGRRDAELFIDCPFPILLARPGIQFEHNGAGDLRGVGVYHVEDLEFPRPCRCLQLLLVQTPANIAEVLLPRWSPRGRGWRDVRLPLD